MDIKVSRNNKTPIYLQIKQDIKNKILLDKLPTGFRLPTERYLSAQLGVSRTTVVMAYHELIADGLVVASAKPKGYFVSEVPKGEGVRTFSPLSKMITFSYTQKEAQFYNLFSLSNMSGLDDYISFAGLVIDYHLFDDGTLQQPKSYDFHCGETDRLKENICRMMKKQNICISKKNVQVVSESTQALEYIAKLYLQRGDWVIVGEPVVPDICNVFRGLGINVDCVKMNRNGIDLDDLEMLIQKRQPKFIYVMPNINNPMGSSMPLANRQRMLEIAYRYCVPIIEENTLRDFRYEDTELPTLYALDNRDSVLYIETFTSTFFLGVNTAFILGPAETIQMIEKLIVTNQTTLYNLGHSILNVHIEDGSYERKIKIMQDYYRNIWNYLGDTLEPLKELGLSFYIPEGGLFFWCRLPKNVSEQKLFEYCKKRKLIYMPGSLFFPFGHAGESYMRICFSNVTEEEIDEGVRIIADGLKVCAE